jgi:small-conductance mechanosensitive channel/predicted O-methyltransferase YrrM
VPFNVLIISLAAILLLAITLATLLLNRKLRRIRTLLRRQERLVWDSQNLFRVLGGEAPLPLPGGWAASTDILGELLRALTAQRPQLVVELGSGLSTLIIAAALKRNNAGRLISIDADADYAQQTRAQLALHGLDPWVQVRVAPLREISFEGVSRPWFDPSALEDLQGIDLLFIDGPPTKLRRDIRYPSLPYFWPRLNAGAWLLLDDAARPAEIAMARRWRQQYPQAQFEVLHFDKGALRMTKPGAADAANAAAVPAVVSPGVRPGAAAIAATAWMALALLLPRGGSEAAEAPKATASVPSGAPAARAAAPAVPDAAQVMQFLDQTVAWYRGLVLQHEIATDPADLVVVADNRVNADQIVHLAFDFARGAAALLAQDGADQAGSSATAGAAAQFQSLVQLQARLDQQIAHSQAELAADRQRLDALGEARREELESHMAAVQGELDLDNARRDAVHSMLEFVNDSSVNGASTGLRGQIEALANSVGPAAAASTATTAAEGAAASRGQANAAAASAASAAGAAGGSADGNSVWDAAARVLALSSKINNIRQLIARTDALREASKGPREPLLKALQSYSTLGDQLGIQANAADASKPAQLAQARAQLDALAGRFKLVAGALIPLAKQGVLLDIYRKSLSNWRDAITGQYHAAIRALLVRIVVLGVILALVFGGAELWKRAVYRYVHEPRRRHQVLVLRRFVLWFLIALVIASAFANRLDSFVTFAGLITAGVAVALQNVILSMVGYFFLVGRYGIRIGDRIQIGDTEGEVIEIGLVRLHLMELGRGGGGATGRVVAFSNSVVFQAASGLFRQLPGISFSWHEITFLLAASADLVTIRQRLVSAIDQAMAQHKVELERQSQEIARTVVSGVGNALHPSVRLRFTAGGIEATVRYPVDLHQAAQIDDAVSQALLQALEREPRLLLAGSGPPDMKLTTAGA